MPIYEQRRLTEDKQRIAIVVKKLNSFLQSWEDKKLEFKTHQGVRNLAGTPDFRLRVLNDYTLGVMEN